ncbi:mechanosensitive ion channel family protein [bacterium]|nr:mechanosensitive ion channel family protein [bacterium]
MNQVHQFLKSEILPLLYTQGVLSIVLLIFVCFILNLIAKNYILKLIEYVIKKREFSWGDAFIKNRPLHNLSKIVPALVVYHFAKVYPDYSSSIQSLTSAYIVYLFVGVLDDLLDTVLDIYQSYPISKTRPIKGYLQVVKILLYCLGFIFVLSALLNKSPFFFLSGLGAMTAVLLLVFKDTILSLVASIQINANQLIQIGDWIEMPKYNADGDVIDLTLHSVMVQNWDKTITSIPTHRFLDESFKNWRGMSQCGSRRICRSINIDLQSIKILDSDLREKLVSIDFLSDYIIKKDQEITVHNQSNKVGVKSPINGRQQTNIGLFRHYLLCYLKTHPKVNQDMTLIVRQKAPSEFGVPIQLYFFATTTDWSDYEEIQSDIFDHIFASSHFFDLDFFQTPSGNDFQKLTR